MEARVFLLAAGLGTRLRPLTTRRPKPLVPVCGRPMLDYALAHARAHGLGPVVVNAFYLAEQVVAWAAKHEGVTVSVEAPEALGTGGGMRKAREQLADRLVALNADTLCDIDLTALLAALDHADAALALRPLAPGERYGEVRVDAEGVISTLAEHRQIPPVGAERPGTHFTGVHALRRALLDELPREGASCVVRQGYAKVLHERRIVGLLHPGLWLDVGDPELYWLTNQQMLSGALRLPLDPLLDAAWAQVGPRRVGGPEAVAGGERVTAEGPFFIGRDVVFEGDAHVGPGTILGAGARVGAGARLEGVVVWDGCLVQPDAHIRRAVVYDGLGPELSELLTLGTR
jgi:mannose-1-phosphate guanylyltransferase